MVERNAETENKAVDVLVDLWDDTISDMAKQIAGCAGKTYVFSGLINSNLENLDIIERALRRLLTPRLKP